MHGDAVGRAVKIRRGLLASGRVDRTSILNNLLSLWEGVYPFPTLPRDPLLPAPAREIGVRSAKGDPRRAKDRPKGLPKDVFGISFFEVVFWMCFWCLFGDFLVHFSTHWEAFW